MGWAKPAGYFVGRLEEAEAGKIVMLVAEADDGGYLGHATIQWASGYSGFGSRGIPEIQDLNVVAEFRRQRIASSLLDAGERLIAGRSRYAGIGVGLYAAYGPAQRLYVKRGYVPDGAGVVRENEPVTPGSSE